MCENCRKALYLLLLLHLFPPCHFHPFSTLFFRCPTPKHVHNTNHNHQPEKKILATTSSAWNLSLAAFLLGQSRNELRFHPFKLLPTHFRFLLLTSSLTDFFLLTLTILHSYSPSLTSLHITSHHSLISSFYNISASSTFILRDVLLLPFLLNTHRRSLSLNQSWQVNVARSYTPGGGLVGWDR